MRDAPRPPSRFLSTREDVPPGGVVVEGERRGEALKLTRRPAAD